MLEEVIVTAQKRTERLQDVPLSVQVLDQEALRQQNLNTLTDLSANVPSVFVRFNGAGTQMFIRGIGSQSNQSFDQSVGMFIDGIYHGRSRLSAGAFLDLERIEILKGPQSTYFGNNAIAGAFSLTTAGPSENFEAYARGLYGEDSQYTFETAFGGPVTDSFGARVALLAEGQDGWVENVNTGRHVPEEENFAGRVTLSFTPSENLDATLKIEGSRNDNRGVRTVQVAECPPREPYPIGVPCQILLDRNAPIGYDGSRNSESPGTGSSLDIIDSVLTVNYDWGGHTLTSVTGYNDYRYELRLDDNLPVERVAISAPERFDQTSQEFRITSPVGGTFEYVAGIYAQTDDLSFVQDFAYLFISPLVEVAPPFAPLVPYLPLGVGTRYSQDEESYAAFGSLTWNVAERLSLTGGLRVSLVEKSFAQSVFYAQATRPYGGFVAIPGELGDLPTPATGLQGLASFLGLGIPGRQSGSRSDSAWLPSAKLQYEFSPERMGYLSYARGFKAGGFNGTDANGDPANLPYEPEWVDAYEVGLKSEWFDRRLLLNLAAFRSEYEDLQSSQGVVQPSGLIQNVVRNAASSISQGVEFEAVWRINDAFRLAAAGTYLDAYYESFPNVTPTTRQIFCRDNYSLPYCAGLPDPAGGPVPPFQDLSDTRTPFAPEWSGSVTGQFTTPTFWGLQFTSELSAYFATDYYLDTHDRWDGAYTRLDGRLTLEAHNGQWALDLIGKNLADDDIFDFRGGLVQSPGSVAFIKQQPRNFALQFRYQWQ